MSENKMTIVTGVDNSKLASGFRKTTETAKKAGKEVGDAFGKTALPTLGALSGTLGGVGGLFAGAGLAASLKEAAQRAEDLGDAAIRLQVSPEQLQILGNAADQNGASLEVILPAIGIFHCVTCTVSNCVIFIGSYRTL